MPSSTSRVWPLTTGGYLLAAQGAALLGIGLVLLQSAAQTAGLATDWESNAVPALAGGLCLALSGVALANVLRFWRRVPAAWLTAMLLQGLSLGLAVILYWRGHRLHSYPMMVVGIFLVLHLNRGDVVALFRPRAAELPPPLREAADE